MSDAGALIEDYIKALRRELAGADPALAQDAAFDVREHLTAAYDERAAARPGTEPLAVFADVVAGFGAPVDVAAAYMQAESRVGPARPSPARAAAPSVARRIFGVFTDPHVYGALFYMVLALPFGVFYFTWAVAGLSLTVGLAILIVGVPFALLFLATVRALSLLEGRIVEALLGVRMPRRPVAGVPGSIWARLGHWFTDARTWSTILYLLLKLPLGIAYFAAATVLVATSLGLLFAPLAYVASDDVVVLRLWNGEPASFPQALLLALLGFALFVGTFHLARAVGRFHGWLAKGMLVRAGRAEEAEPQPSPSPAHAQ